MQQDFHAFDFIVHALNSSVAIVINFRHGDGLVFFIAGDFGVAGLAKGRIRVFRFACVQRVRIMTGGAGFHAWSVSEGANIRFAFVLITVAAIGASAYCSCCEVVVAYDCLITDGFVFWLAFSSFCDIPTRSHPTMTGHTG